MIRINLLGESAIQDNSGKMFVLAYGGSIVLLVLVMVAIQQLVSSEVSTLSEQKVQLTKQLAALEEKTTEVRDLEKRKKELDEKLSVIAKLKLSKKGPVRVLDEINRAVPEKLWVNDIREVRGQLSMSGIALDYPSIVEFMKTLEKSPYFLEVNLKETGQAFLVKQGAKSGGKKGSRPAAGTPLDPGYRLKKYDGLSSEEQEAFNNDKPGFGNRVRTFTLQCEISYLGLPKVTVVPTAEEKDVKKGKKRERSES